MSCAVLHRVQLLWTAYVLALVLAAAAWGVRDFQTPMPEGPNVVVIVADDLGFMDVNFTTPDTFHETPNLARLARLGTRFTNGYAAAPVCSPTRASLMTGKHPARLGITNVILTRPNKAKQMVPAANKEHLDAAETTVANAFREAGYRMLIAGKWHLGRLDSIPSNHGFDSDLINSKQLYFPDQSRALSHEQDPKQSERLANDATAFIKTAGDHQFFAYLSFPAPHIPLIAPPELIEKYARKLEGLPNPRPSTANPVYAAMIEQLDQAVGRVLDMIESQGIADRTIIVFISDNGGLEHFATSNAPLRGGKGTLYEGGIRVPWVIVAPHVASPGGTSDSVVFTADVYPTLLELAGLPPRPAQHADGISLVPSLRGQALPPRNLCWHFPHYSVGPPAGAIRSGDWKLVEWFEDGRTELFNLRDDISESVDLSDQEPERARSLHASLVAWRADVCALMPTFNPAWKTKNDE